MTEPDDEGDRRRTYNVELSLAKIEGKLDAIIAVQTATLGPDMPLFDAASGALVTKTLLFASGENTQMRNFGSWASGGRYRGGVSWSTSDAWPSSLPGTAA